MSIPTFGSLGRSSEEVKESEENLYDPIDDEFLRTAFRNRNDAPQNLGLDRDKDAKVTFIIGESGSGKSTLTSWFENPMLTAESDGTCWLFSGDANSKVIIGNGTSSCTELPTRIVRREDDSIYYDFPGFFDSRDTAKEIACSFYLDTLINQTETFRIILTVDYHMFHCGRSKPLIDLVDYMQGLFPDIDLLLKALFIVVTKAPKKENVESAHGVPEMGGVEAIQAKVSQYLNSSKRLSNRVSNILMWLADPRQAGRIEVFREPSQSGKIDQTTLQNILAKLANVSFITKQAIKPYIPKETQYYIIKLVERLQDKMNIEVLKIIQKIEEICQRMIYNNSFEELTKFISSVKEDINAKEREYQENKNLACFLFKLYLYAKEINDYCVSPIEPLNLEALKKTEDAMITLKEIRSTIEFNVELWWHHFRALKDRIAKIINFNYSEEPGGVLKIKGIAIKVKKIESLFKENLTSIEIHCVGVVFFDEVNIRCPGVNIAIVAPLWRINGINVIDISGKEGLPLPPREEDYHFDGQPGNPGGNAGNFLGVCEKYVWNGELKIIANGGKGGPGENGLDESEKLEKMMESLSKREPKPERKKPGPRPEPAHHQPIDLENRGGKGGCGGCGGNRGEVKITDEVENLLRIVTEKKHGESGENGCLGLKKERRQELPLPKGDGKEPLPLYLAAIQRCCGFNNISDEPRPRSQRSQSVEVIKMSTLTELTLTRSARLRNNRPVSNNPEEINVENLIEPSPNIFPFNEKNLQDTYNSYFNEVGREEGLQEIIGNNSLKFT